MGNGIIPVVLTNNTYIEYREPFIITEGFDKYLLKCMAWNEITNQF